jgi:hypothetical protein
LIPSTTITNTIRASDDEDMPLMSVCQTPPQSAASSTSLVNDNPFLNLLNTSISSSTNNETSETLAAAAAVAVAVTLLPPPKVPQKNDSITDLNAFKTQLKIQHERLKENLRDSYQRLRLNQTKYFQSHIRRHLNKKANEEKVTPQIDDTSIDLLNSILTSNATPTPTTPNTLSSSSSSSSSTTHQTRLIDDIQYELLKQNEDKSHKRSSYLKELNLNVKKMKRSSTRRGSQLRVKQITHDDSDQTESECSSDESSLSDVENEFVDVVSETERESSSHTGSNLTTNGSATANAYWLMRRVQLGCEWQRVQLKMKMLQQKNKQCNDFIHSHNSLIKSFDAKLVKSTKLIEKLESSSSSSSSVELVDSHHASSSTSPSNEMPIEKAAIDALSNELQECVAVINRPTDEREKIESQQQTTTTTTTTTTTSNNNNNNNRKSIATNSRCSTESRNVNLFNLAKCGDMVSFNDEDLCNSLKCALTYFRENLFKTACLCEKSSGVKKRKSKSQILTNVANVKTCIFCHLFKTYENNRKLINEPETSTTSTTNTCDQMEEYSPAPNLSNILYEHSYCKQPKVSMIKKAKAKSLKNDKNTTTTTTTTTMTTKLVDFDDGLQLDKVVTERLNRLFESKKNSYKTLFDDDYELDLKQDESMIEAGFDLSPSDIKKLPNLSYEE